MHKVIDDFLDKEDFIFINNLIMNEPFPWFYMDSYRETGLDKSKSDNFSYLDNTLQVESLIHFLLFLLGSLFGMISFSQVIAWIFNKYKNCTIALLTGFVFGSLAIIWPWKNPVINPEMLNRHGEEMIIGYQRYLPNLSDANTLIAISCILIGVLCIWAVEKLAVNKDL